MTPLTRILFPYSVVRGLSTRSLDSSKADFASNENWIHEQTESHLFPSFWAVSKVDDLDS